MPSVMATIKVKEDKIEQAKEFLSKLASDTLASEEPTVFVFYEKYASEEAFKIHGKNLASRGAGFGEILAGPPDIVMLDEL
jgi:quinol monooxygenase YgiN